MNLKEEETENLGWVYLITIDPDVDHIVEVLKSLRGSTKSIVRWMDFAIRGIPQGYSLSKSGYTNWKTEWRIILLVDCVTILLYF